jgi:hypothetical protein
MENEMIGDHDSWWKADDRDARKGKKPRDTLQDIVVIASAILALFVLSMIVFMLSATANEAWRPRPLQPQMQDQRRQDIRPPNDNDEGYPPVRRQDEIRRWDRQRINYTTKETMPIGTDGACHDGSDRRILIINKASKRMTVLAASPVDNPKWTYNMLQGKVLRPGESVMADIDDGTCYCLYDMMAQLADGRTAVKENANVCTGTTWTITD